MGLQLIWTLPVEAAPGLVQATAGGSIGDGNNLAVSYTVPPTPGNLLVAVGNCKASSLSISGWSVALDESANAPGQAIFYKVATAAEPSLVTLDSTTSTKSPARCGAGDHGSAGGCV